MPIRGLCPCRVGSQPSMFRKRCGRSSGLPSAAGRGMAGSGGGVGVSVGMAAAVWNKPEAPAVTAGASSLIAPLPVGLLPRFPAGQGRGQGRRLAARMLRVCLAVRRWVGGGGVIESWGASAGEIQPSSRSTSPFRTAQTTISCLLPNPSLSCMW